ncbi:MAG: CoA-binding protein [Deltaproteobacteria bacterium]|nr:CoA-binding protein [Deltaproteobacteria bacterium]
MSDIDIFLSSDMYAVAGASTNREKYGNKVVRAYLQQGKTVFPINPSASTVEGLDAYPNVDSLPEGVTAISIVTPAPVTLAVVKSALERKITRIWMQPGAENAEAIDLARAAGALVIADGACVLVALGYREEVV